MKFIGHRFVFAAAAAFFAFAGKGDDAVGVMRIDAGTNGIVEAEMPFDAVDGNGPSDFISGFFMGDGSIFSDRLYRVPLTTNDYPLATDDYAFYSSGAWLDSVTLSNSTMTASAGDTLYLLRTDSDPFSFYLHGRIPYSLSQLEHPNTQTLKPYPIFSGISVDPAETNAVIAMETDRAADLFFAQAQTNAPIPSVWSYLGRHPGSFSFLFPLASPLTANDYPLTAFFISDATRDTDGDGLPDALEEFVHGTNPLLADTDGDGVSDTLEIAWGRDPLVADSAPLTLFSEPFEAPDVLPGPLDGQNGWIAATGAVVQSSIVHSGNAALEIFKNNLASNETATASHPLTNNTPDSVVWLDCHMTIGTIQHFSFPPDDTIVSFVCDNFYHPIMVNGDSLVTNSSVTISRTLHRVTMKLDFATRLWDLYIDGIIVGENLAMRGSAATMSGMIFEGNHGFADDISMTTSRPDGLSSDDDAMPDEWEIVHFGDLSRDGTQDFDSDGLSDADEYAYGANPANPDTDGDGLPDLWEAANGLDPADPSDAALDPDGDGLANAEEFLKGGDPNFSEPDPTLRMPGLLAEYWRTSSNLQTLPGYESLMPSHVSVSPVVDHPAVPWIAEGTMPGDGFAARYTGYIRIPRDGDYVFYLTSDDGSAFFIDGVAVASDPEPHSARTSYGNATLSAGWHPAEIRYYENTGSESLKLEWSSADIQRAVVPAEALCHVPAGETFRGFSPGIAASFYTLPSGLASLPDFSALAPVDTRIVPSVDEPETSGSWRNAPDGLLDNFGAVYEGYLHVPRSGRWEMKLSSDDGSRLYVDGALAIDHDGAHSMSGKTANMLLSRGLHAIRVEYFEKSANAGLRLSWALSGFPSEAVPSRFFYRESGAGTDADSDGIPDWWEEMNALDPEDASDAALDTDGDGLSNAEEAAFGSDPRLSDTDGDGLADAEEAAFGSSPIAADTDGDGLTDAVEMRYGWNPNWPGETDEANAPVGPFTTFTHYADGTGGIAQFHVDVDFQEPYPTNATVYGLASPGGTAYVDDMITRDPDKDFTSISTSNIIYVTTLDPKPAFCTNVAGVLILKMRCDDHATVSVGGISVQNSWPNQEYAKAWGIIEANTTNVVDITWDSSRGGKWNLDYECYFYPAKFRPPCPEDDDCECGCGYAFNARNGSVSIRQPFGETPNVPSLPRGSLRIREVEPSSRLASPECLYYDHPMERRVKVSDGASSTISVPNGEEIVYMNGKPHGYSAGLDSSLSVDAAGRLVERLSDGLLVVYGANGVPVALKPEHCREIAVAELGISVARDSQGAISSIESASDGTMSVARTSSYSFNVTWTDATNGYVKTFMFSQPSSNIFELNEFVNPSMNTTYRWEYSEEERGWTFVNDYGKADARTESRTAVWNDEARTWTKTQVWYDSDGTPGETETKVYTANGHYPKLSRIERGDATVYQAAHGATGRAGTTTNETGLATENVHDRYGRRVKSSQIVKGGLVETETTSYKPVSAGEFVDFRPVRTIRTLDGIEIERTAWLYETNRTTIARTANGVTRTSFTEYDGLGREVLYVSEDGRATRRTYSTDLPVGACTETSETGVFSNGAFSLVDGKSERTVSERNAFGDEIRTERFALVGGEWHSLSFETKTYNAKHQVVSTQYSNGKSSSAAWICTGPLWQVGTDGIATTNVYDGTKSLVSSTRYSPLGAVTTEYVRDCRGRAVQETESAPGVETRTTARTYDARGRLASMTDAQGRTTAYAYSADNRTTTETLPSGAARITTVNPDGSIASVTGTAQAAEFYSYGVTEDGLEWTQVNYLSPDGARWRRTYVNGFGETVREEWPSFGDVLTQRRRDVEYDAKGRLVSVEETGKPIETRAYDNFGEVTNVTFTVGRDAPIAPPETRTVATDWHFAVVRDDPIAPLSNEIWRVSSRTVFCSDPSIAPLVTTNMTQVSGLSLTNESRSVSIDIRGNASESWSEFDPAMSKRISYARIPTATNIALEETIDGATIRSVSHSAVTNTATYDAYRRETVRTDGRGNAMTNAYDTLGRLSSVTDPLGATTHYAYDAVGNLIAITNALGNATIYEYDIRGNKTYEGGVTYPVRYTYDDFNVMTNMTTYRNESLQSGDTTTWLYDEPTGLLTNKVYADGKGPTYTYTLDGKLATRTWARGITTDYSYDGWGNLRNTVYSDGTPAILLFYDALGRQTEAYDAAGVTTFFYDMYGTLTNEAVRCTRGALVAWQGQETTNVVSRYYDSFGRNAGYAINGVRQSTLAYDPATGRHASMLADGSTNVFAWTYLPGSDLKFSLAYPNGLTASWTYDANNQLLQVRNAFPTNIISQYDYSYDAAGRRIEIARSGSAMSGNRTDSYGYNVRDELISATKTGGTASVPSTTEYAYQYDDIGNRITSFDLGTNRTYTANNLNQYLEISTSDAGLQTSEFEPQYDDDGNQTLIQTSTGIWSVTYNGENRPILWERIASDSNTQNSNTQTLISMSYDRMGRRVSYLETCNSITNSNKVFSYDGYLQIANLELTTQNSQFFIWDATEPVATRPIVFYNSNAPPQYYTHDGNKNVSDLTDSCQSLCAHYAYAPFGALLFSLSSSAITNPFRFSSEYADDALGLVYYNYRHYNPVIGRWMSREPEEGEDIYLYGDNSPIDEYDFLGLRVYVIDNRGKQSRQKEREIGEIAFRKSRKIAEEFYCYVKNMPDGEFMRLSRCGCIKFNGEPFKGTKSDYLRAIEREKDNQYHLLKGRGRAEVEKLLADAADSQHSPYDVILVAVHGAIEEHSLYPRLAMLADVPYYQDELAEDFYKILLERNFKGSFYFASCYRTWDEKSKNTEDFQETMSLISATSNTNGTCAVDFVPARAVRQLVKGAVELPREKPPKSYRKKRSRLVNR